MRILVDHGASNNLGDTSMIEGAVLRLLDLLPGEEIFVIDRPSLKTKIFGLPNVLRQEDYSVKPMWADVLTDAPFLWRYSQYWKKIASKLTLVFRGNLLSPSSFAENGELRSKNMSLSDFCERFDALHIVGGGNLTDVFYHELFRKCLLIHAFAEQDKPIILTGQQLGPFSSHTFKKALTKSLLKASFVGLREGGNSLALCQEAPLEAKCFDVMGDDSFGLSSVDDNHVLAILSQYGIKENRFLAFNIRIGYYAKEHTKHMKQISKIMDKLSMRFRMPIMIVPIALNESDNDITSGRKLAKLTCSSRVLVLENNNLTPDLVKGILGKAFGAVGVSYHFCIFALSQGVPAVCLYDGNYYSQKARGICSFWGDNRLALPLRNMDADLAVSHISRIFEDELLCKKLSRRSKEATEQWQGIFDKQVSHLFGRSC